MGRHFERGQVLFDLGRYREAAKEYLAELEENPHHVACQTNLVASLIGLNDLRGAEKSLNNALSQSPSYAHNHFLLSHIHLRRSRMPAALNAAKEAISLSPKAEYFAHYAYLLDRDNEKKLALEMCEKGLELDPRYVKAIVHRAELLFQCGRHGEAHEAFGMALQIAPEKAETHAAVGKAALLKGNVDFATHSLVEARRLNPTDSQLHESIATAYGLTLPVIRWLNPLVIRWHHLPFRVIWICSLLLCLVFTYGCIAFNPVHHINSANLPWIVTCIVITNYLTLMETFPRLARVVACLVAWKKMGIARRYLVFAPFNIVLIAMLHSLAFAAGIVMSILPELGFIVFGLASCYPLFQEGALWGDANKLANYALFGFAALLAFTLWKLEVGAYIQATILFVSFFVLSYYSDRIAYWRSSPESTSV